MMLSDFQSVNSFFHKKPIYGNGEEKILKPIPKLKGITFRDLINQNDIKKIRNVMEAEKKEQLAEIAHINMRLKTIIQKAKINCYPR